MVLVDSSIYVHLLRSGRDPTADLVERFGSAELLGCDLVRCEVLRGVIDPRAHADMAEFFSHIGHVPMSQRAWRDTEAMAWRLDRAGRRLPLSDLIIAICAFHAGATVLTNDKHFALIPQLELASW